MSQKNSPAGVDSNAASQQTGKRPYVKPDFRFEKVFETLALVCGKLHGQQGQCRLVRKTS
jgi:hypothetical protein